MRNPNFGNKFKFVPNTRTHRNLSQELRTYQGAIPTWEGFTVEYSALSETDLNTLETFLTSSAGKEVTLTDFEGRTWTGVVVSPEITIVEGKEGCNWSVSFDFEGHVTGALSETFTDDLPYTLNDPWSSSVSPNPEPGLDLPTSALKFRVSAETGAVNLAGSQAVSGQPLSKWADDAGTPGDLLPVYSGTSAIFMQGALNGRDGIKFIDNQPYANAITYPPTFTVYVVAKMVAGGVKARIMGGRNNNWLLGWWAGSMDQVVFETAVRVSAGDPPADDSVHLYIATYDGTTVNVWRDHILLVSGTMACMPPSGIVLGGWYFDHTETSDCIVGTAALYEGAFTEDQVATLRDQLTGYYGIGAPAYSPPAKLHSLYIASAGALNLTGQQALSGQAVGRWQSLGPVAYNADLLPIDVDGYAQFAQGGLNGRDAVKFIAGKRLANRISYPPAYTAYVVAKTNGIKGTVMGSWFNAWFLGWAGGKKDVLQAGNIVTDILAAPADDGNPHVYMMTCDGDTIKLWRDKTKILEASGMPQAPDGLVLGANGGVDGTDVPLLDFDFETDPNTWDGTHAYAVLPTNLPWTFTGAAGVRSATSDAPAPDGSLAGYLQNNGTISQDFEIIDAGFYRINVRAATWGHYYGGSLILNVKINGIIIATFATIPKVTPAGLDSYSTLPRFFFNGVYTLQFEFTNYSGTLLISIDNVTIKSTADFSDCLIGEAGLYTNAFTESQALAKQDQLMTYYGIGTTPYSSPASLVSLFIPENGALTSAGDRAQNDEEVVLWNDELDAGNLEPVGAIHALYAEGALGGHDAVRFLDVQKFANNYGYTAPFTLYIVAQILTGVEDKIISGTNNVWYLGWNAGNMDDLYMGFVLAPPTTPVANDFDTHVYWLDYDGTTIRMWRDGALILTRSGVYAPPDGITLGGSDALVGEVGMYTGIVPDGDRDAIIDRLKDFYGII